MSNKTSDGPLVLCILEGLGEGADGKGNAAALANTPNLDALRRDYPSTLLAASGAAVGLREGQPGNAEMGYRTIAAGRPLTPIRKRIDKLVLNDHIGRNEMVAEILSLCTFNDYALHLFGLLSGAGVHSDEEHLYALIELADFNEIPVIVHGFLDGRDIASGDGLETVRRLETLMEGKDAKLGTLSGSYYAMDRGKRWDRTYQAFHAIVRDVVLGEPAPVADTSFELFRESHQFGLTDDMIPPTRLADYRGIKGNFMCDFAAEEPEWQWHAEAAGLCFNYRADRAEQLAAMFTRQVPDEVANDLLIDRKKPVIVFERDQLATLTTYNKELVADVGFVEEPVPLSLGEVLASHKLRQLRCGETENRAGITTFFNCGRHTPFEGEVRRLVNSSLLVDSFVDQPAMRAAKVAAAVVAAVESGEHDVIVVSFASPNELGHSGDLAAAIEAMEAIDVQLEKIVSAIRASNGRLLVTSSHGNCETMKDEVGEADRASTVNPVPFIYVNDADRGVSLREGGSLADVAPTILDLLGIEPPEEMTGVSLRTVSP